MKQSLFKSQQLQKESEQTLSWKDDRLQGSSNLCRLSKAAILDLSYTLLPFHKTFMVLFSCI